MDATRVLVDRSREYGGIAIGSGAVLNMVDAVVQDVRTSAAGVGGRGLNIQSGATARISRTVVTQTRATGVFVAVEGTRAELSDIVIHGSGAHPCDGPECPLLGGRGVGTYLLAQVAVRRFAIDDAELCGVHLALGGELDLSDGRVRGCPIGVCLQTDPYDTDRLTRGVRFVDNETNLQATTLPIPDAAGSFEIEMP